jgi:hypothetical protein
MYKESRPDNAQRNRASTLETKETRSARSHKSSLVPARASRPRNPSSDSLASITASSDSAHRISRHIPFRKGKASNSKKGLSYDGTASNSGPSASAEQEPSSARHPQGYHDSARLPEYTDSRAGYGRRITRDFGFPGARIRPLPAGQVARAVRGPSDWIKESYGPPSGTLPAEGHEEKSQQGFQRDGTPTITRSPERLPPRHLDDAYRAGIQEAIEPTASTPAMASSSKGYNLTDQVLPKRRRHWSRSTASDMSDNIFAKEMETLLENIIEDHQKTLEHTIEILKSSHSTLAQCHKLSRRILQHRRNKDNGEHTKQQQQPPRRNHPCQAAHNPDSVDRPISEHNTPPSPSPSPYRTLPPEPRKSST